MKNYADVVFVNGSVITVDDSDRVCEAVAIAGNRIVRVGESHEVNALAGPETRVVDLKGRSLLPGFVDAHCHPGYHGAVKLQIRCGHQDVQSIEDIKREIKKRASTTPRGEWILGRGYDHNKLKEKRHPTRWDFDEAAPDHKVFITRACGHMSVANSMTLAEFGIGRETPDPHGGKIDRDSRGEPTGLLFEHAQIPIRMRTQPSYEDLEKGMKMMNYDFLSRGITSAHDASGRNPGEIRLFQKGVSEGWIQVRLYFMVRTSGTTITLGEQYLSSGLVTGFGNEKLRLGAYKLQMDGAGSGGSAAMREPYPDDPTNYGILHMTQEELDELVMRGHKTGYQVGVHALGDRAVEMTLQSFEKALRLHPRENHRHRIEHCGLLDGPIMDKIRDLGAVPALGLPFLYEMGDSYISSFGVERLSCAYPLRSLMDRGIISPLSSDTPVIDPNPMHGIYFAVTRKTPSGQIIAPNEAVSVMQAIRAYTVFGAYASFEEGIKGSIEVGKLADLVVLSRNILETPAEEILGINVDLTMVDGTMVYEKE
ncbi:MAG: amidohydrolase [Deltaproteobacteria bacterium]|nr:amidohydrolase [Deltaproteobacteria bacterium]